MIDDRADVVRYNTGNSIVVPPWKGSPSDNYLYRLCIVLKGIRTQNIVTQMDEAFIDLKEITS